MLDCARKFFVGLYKSDASKRMPGREAYVQDLGKFASKAAIKALTVNDTVLP